MVKTNKTTKIIVALLLAFATVLAVIALNPVKNAKAYSTVHTVNIDINGGYDENATAFSMAEAVQQLKELFAEEEASASECQAVIVILADEDSLFTLEDGDTDNPGADWVTGLTADEAAIRNKDGDLIASVLIRGADAELDAEFNIIEDDIASVICTDYEGSEVGIMANNYEFQNVVFTSESFQKIDCTGVTVNFGTGSEFYAGENMFSDAEGVVSDKVIGLTTDVHKVKVDPANADGIRTFATTQEALLNLKNYYANSEYNADKCLATIQLYADCNTAVAGATQEKGMFSDDCISVLNKAGDLIGKITIIGMKSGITVTTNNTIDINEKYISNNYELLNFTYRSAKSKNMSYYIGAYGYLEKTYEAIASNVVFGEGFEIYSAEDTSANIFMARASDPNNNRPSRSVSFEVYDADLATVSLTNSANNGSAQTFGKPDAPWTSKLVIGGKATVNQINGTSAKASFGNFIADVTLKGNSSTKSINLITSGTSDAAVDYTDNVDIHFAVKENAEITGNTRVLQRATYNSYTVNGKIAVEVDASALDNITPVTSGAGGIYLAYSSLLSGAENKTIINADMEVIFNGEGFNGNTKDAFYKFNNIRCVTVAGKFIYTINGGTYDNQNILYDPMNAIWTPSLGSVYADTFELVGNYKNANFTNANIYFGFHNSKCKYSKLTDNFLEGNTIQQNVMCASYAGSADEYGDVEVNFTAPITFVSTNANIRATSYSQPQHGDVTINFFVPEGGTPYEFTAAGLSAVGTGKVLGNVTWNFEEGVTIKSNVRLGGESGTPLIDGDIVANYNGANFVGSFAGALGTINNVTQNINAGTFGIIDPTDGKTVIGGAIKAVADNSVISGSVTNNFGTKSGETAPIFNAATYFGGSGAYTCPLLVNNVYGGIFEKYVGFGTNGGSAQIDEIVNNIYGGTFESYYIGSNYSFGTHSNITNNIVGEVFFNGAYFGATVCDGTACQVVDANVTNNVKADPEDPTKFPHFKQPFNGVGEFASCTGKVTNNIEAGEFSSTFNASSKRADTTGVIQIGEVENNLSGGTYLGTVSLGATSGTILGNVTNNIKDCVFKGEFAGGGFVNKADTKLIIEGKIINKIENCIRPASEDTSKDANARFVLGTYDMANPGLSVAKGGVDNTINGLTCALPIYQASWNSIVGEDGNKTLIVKSVFNEVYCPNQIGISNRGFVNGDIDVTFNGGNQFKDPSIADTNNPIVNATMVLGTYGGNIVGKVNLTINGGMWGQITCGNSAAAASSDGLSAKITIKGGGFARIVSNSKPCPTDIIIDLADDDVQIYGNNNLRSNENIKITVIPSESHKIIFHSASLLGIDEIVDNGNKLKVDQKSEWLNGYEYIVLDKKYEPTIIQNVAKNAPGSLDYKAGTTQYVFRGENMPIFANSLYIGGDISVNYYIEKDEIDNYIKLSGGFSYQFAGSEKISFATVAEAEEALEVKEYNGINYYIIAIDGIAPTQFFKNIELSMSGHNGKDITTVNTLLKKVADSQSGYSDSFKNLCKAMFNYGIEACNAFAVEGAPALTKYDGINYAGDYASNASKKNDKTDFQFYGTGVTLDSKVSMNFYAKVADGITSEDLTVKVNGSEITDFSFEAIDGSSDYNYVLSFPIDIRYMADQVVVEVSVNGVLNATITDSISYYCIDCINKDLDYKAACEALLAYVEAADTYFAEYYR